MNEILHLGHLSINFYSWGKGFQILFYTETLGFKVEYQRIEEWFAFLSFWEAQLMLDQIDKWRTWKTWKLTYPLGIGINFQIKTENIQRILDNLERNKIELFLEPDEKWYQSGEVESWNKQFLVQDPDWYLLRFFEDLWTRPF